MISDGSDPAWRGGKVLHLVLHQVLHHPTRRAAPAAKKGGSLPSFPSPLARLGSAGSGRKTRRETADNGRRQWYTPHRVLWYTPPSDRVPFRAAPTATPASTPERSRQQVNITFVIPPPRTPAQRNAGAGRVGRFRPHRRCGRRRAARRQDHERRAVPGVRQRTASARPFRDWAEETDHPREVIEAALAHVVQNKVEATYACACLFTMLLRESVFGPMETGRREPFGPNCLLSRSWPGGSPGGPEQSGGRRSRRRAWRAEASPGFFRVRPQVHRTSR